MKEQAVSGTKRGLWWRGSATIIVAALQLIQLFFLARWLAPETFGLYAILRTIIGFGGYFSDAGMYNAILYGKPLDHRLFSTLFWISVGAGLLMLMILYAVSPVLEDFYQMPGLSGPVVYVGVILLFMAMGSHYKAVLQRDMKYKSIAIVDIIAHNIGFFTTIIYGYLFKDVMALVYGYLARTMVASAGYFIQGHMRHPLSFQFTTIGLRYYLSYASYQLPERWLGYLSSNMDVLIIGKVLGSEVLGVYELFKQFLRRGIHLVNPLLDHVYVPVMTSYHREGKPFQAIYFQMVRWSAWLLFPFYTLLIIFANSFIAIFFGSVWVPHFPLFQWLCVYFALHSVVQHIGAWWVAINRPDLGFYWNLGLLPVMFFSIYFAAQHGIVVVAMTITLLMLLQGFLLYWTMIYPQPGVELRDYIRSFGYPLSYTLFSFFPLFGMKWYHWGSTGWMWCITAGLLLFYLWMVWKYETDMIKTIIKHTRQ